LKIRWESKTVSEKPPVSASALTLINPLLEPW
jgi:hypothetical protein